MTRPFPAAGPRALTVAVLAALALVWGGYNLGRAVFGPKLGEDFRQYYVGSRMVLEGSPELLYSTRHIHRERARAYGVPQIRAGDEEIDVMVSPYPPPVALLLAPFALLPYHAALLAFSLLSFAASVLATILLFADRADRQQRRFVVATGLALSALFFPHAYSLYMGQVNGLLLLLCVLALHLSRRGRDAWAGLALAGAIVLKLFPAILLLFFAFQRRFTTLLAALVGVAGLTLASLPWFPPATWADYLVRVLPGSYSGGAMYRNQGLHGALSRLLTENPYVPPWVEAPGLVAPLVGLGAIAVLAALVAGSRRPTAPTSPRYAMAFGLYLVAALLILSKSWEHYAIFLLPAFFLVGEDRIARGDFASVFLLASAFSVWAFVLTTGAEYEALPRTAIAQPLFALKLVATAVLFAVGIAACRDGAHAPAMEEPSP